MPHRLQKMVNTLVCSWALVNLLCGQSVAADSAVQLRWHTPPRGKVFTTSENMTRQIHYEMNGVLRSMAGSRADPVNILEDRNQSISVDSHGRCWLVSEDDSRRYGGDHPKDPSVKRRQAYESTPVDASGALGPLGPFNESDDSASPTPTPPPLRNAACVTQPSPAPSQSPRYYKDAGDAALAELPTQPVGAGETWTFSRPVHVERELGSGMMTFTNKLQRVEERVGQAA